MPWAGPYPAVRRSRDASDHGATPSRSLQVGRRQDDSLRSVYRPAGSEIDPIAITCNVGTADMRRWPGYIGWGEAAAAAGLASVHYVSAGPDAVAGFDALLEALRARAGDLRLDTARIVVWGGSAGYRLLGAGKDSEAVELFALTARRYPHSANAWESYSEALEKVGRRKEALEMSRRALSLAPPQNVRDAAEARVKRLSQR